MSRDGVASAARWAVSTALACTLALAGCAGPPSVGQGLEPTGAAAQGAEYRLQVGDRILISDPFNPEYSMLAIVAPDGQISAPGVKQQLAAEGSTVPELSRRLQAAYKQSGLLTDARPTVRIQAFGGQHVFVGGEVLRSGAIRLEGPRTVLQMVMAAGGPLPTAFLDGLELLHIQPDGQAVLIPVRLGSVLDGTDLSQNVPVQAMDVIIVPKSRIASYDVFIEQYVRLALPVPTSVLLEYLKGQFIPR